VSDDAVERLVGAAERLGEYLVWLSKQDDRIRDDAEMHDRVDDLYVALRAARETRHN
jgi:hypothetical protein